MDYCLVIKSNEMKKILLIFIVSIFVSCCNNKEIQRVNKMYLITKQQCLDRVNVGLFNHFPDTLSSGFISFNPRKESYYRYESYILTYDYSSEKEQIDSLIRDSVIFYTRYCDDNMIINLTDTMFSKAKCNKYPIPHFDSEDFGLGAYRVNKEFSGGSTSRCIFYLPDDLEVYVISSKPGYYFTFGKELVRPEELKEWKHGYSRGIATSKKLDEIYYWAIVW